MLLFQMTSGITVSGSAPQSRPSALSSQSLLWLLEMITHELALKSHSVLQVQLQDSQRLEDQVVAGGVLEAGSPGAQVWLQSGSAPWRVRPCSAGLLPGSISSDVSSLEVSQANQPLTYRLWSSVWSLNNRCGFRTFAQVAPSP